MYFLHYMNNLKKGGLQQIEMEWQQEREKKIGKRIIKQNREEEG